MKKSCRIALYTLAITMMLQAVNLLANKSGNFYLNENFFLGIVNSNLMAIVLSMFVLIGSMFLFNSFPPLAFFAAGILSNVIDRIAYGGVIDYIKFPFWPVFNLADALICIGAVWLVFLLIKKEPV